MFLFKQKMRKKREEIERLEHILAEKDLERLNEENQKKEEVEDKRRKKVFIQSIILLYINKISFRLIHK